MVCSPPEKPVRLQVHSCLFMLLPQCLSAPNCQIALPCISCKRTLASTMCVCVSELRLCISITFDTRLRHGSVSPISYTLQGPVTLPKRRCITLSLINRIPHSAVFCFPFPLVNSFAAFTRSVYFPHPDLSHVGHRLEYTKWVIKQPPGSGREVRWIFTVE